MTATEEKIDAGISAIIKKLPSTLHSDISYLFKGKRMRSKLMMELATLINANLSAIVLPAVGVEMVHTISLIHDDVIDRQAERRGKATLHHLYNNRLAVLVGDFLLQGLVQQLEGYRYHPEAVKVLYEKIAELCKGEVLQDIPPKSKTQNLTTGETRQKKARNSRSAEREQYLSMVKQKTGSLFSYSFMVPLLTAMVNDKADKTKKNQKNQSATGVHRLTMREKNLIRFAEECGYVYGIAFQLADDLADLEEDLALLAYGLGPESENNLTNEGLRLPSYAVMAWAENDPQEFKRFCKYLGQSGQSGRGKTQKKGKPVQIKVTVQVKKDIKAIIQNEINENLRELGQQVGQGVTQVYFDFLNEKVSRLFG